MTKWCIPLFRKELWSYILITRQEVCAFYLLGTPIVQLTRLIFSCCCWHLCYCCCPCCWQDFCNCSLACCGRRSTVAGVLDVGGLPVVGILLLVATMFLLALCMLLLAYLLLLLSLLLVASLLLLAFLEFQLSLLQSLLLMLPSFLELCGNYNLYILYQGTLKVEVQRLPSLIFSLIIVHTF